VSGEPKGKGPLGRIILKWNLEKQGVRMWTGSSGGPLLTFSWTFRFHKRWGISCLAEWLLASQNEPSCLLTCSMVTFKVFVLWLYACIPNLVINQVCRIFLRNCFASNNCFLVIWITRAVISSHSKITITWMKFNNGGGGIRSCDHRASFQS
jgi:hypothetical protein